MLWELPSRVTKDCGAPCNSMFFSENERTVLKYWVGSWAAVCVASCLFTVLTFMIDSSRFRYPERPIVFLAICYLIVGCAYVAGLGAGDSVACREPFQPQIKLGRMHMLSTITQGHRQSTSCTVLFMALYFCCMAAFAWWACLALAWFLAAGLKWGHEAIENRSHLFHLVAWAIPAVQTIFVLALGKVEGLEVIGSWIHKREAYFGVPTRLPPLSFPPVHSFAHQIQTRFFPGSDLGTRRWSTTKHNILRGCGRAETSVGLMVPAPGSSPHLLFYKEEGNHPP
ncbi:frizzled [Culex quinquefasciatus]|uniref:Frizzled n=1 Tax=Culex quinquefasciatus TaxID=7176 RepID=B0WLH4_CULQU|nr:frizzled [Culex quinquefasciatus]|eukprot:XP_001849558.1 frizzled [Culex quinquefasciatus]